MSARASPLPWHRWRRRLRRHRRGLSAALAGLCLICSLEAAAPARPVTVGVLVAAHDLTGGSPLTPGDLALARLPPSAVPGARCGAQPTRSGAPWPLRCVAARRSPTSG